MDESGNKRSNQQLIVDHLIQQMTSGINHQGQYSQFGYATQSRGSWSQSASQFDQHLFDFNQTSLYSTDFGRSERSHNRLNDEDAFFPSVNRLPTSEALFYPDLRLHENSSEADNDGTTRNHKVPVDASGLFEGVNNSVKLLRDDSVPGPDEVSNSSRTSDDQKPSYSDIVSKIKKSTSVVGDQRPRQCSDPNPVPSQFGVQVKRENSSSCSSLTKSKSKGDPRRVKRQQSMLHDERNLSGYKDLSYYDVPQRLQQKFDSHCKKNDAPAKKRRNSIDLAFSYGIEDISLTDPSPSQTKANEGESCGNIYDNLESDNSEAFSVNRDSHKTRDVPLNNENSGNSVKASASKRPLNINNNLCSSNDKWNENCSNVKASPTLKSCNQDGWEGNVAKGKQPKSGSALKSQRKSSDVKSNISCPGNQVNSQNRPDKRQKESGCKRRKRKCGEGCLYAEEFLKVAKAYLYTWSKIILAFLVWLFHLTYDVSLMSTRLVIHLSFILWDKTKIVTVGIFLVVSAYLRNRLDFIRWPFNRIESDSQPSGGLTENITLPITGEEAMKRLLACRGSDPYGILGVTTECGDEDIKKYYKRQAILVHPDKNRQPGSEEAFKILGHAFDLIGEPEKRKVYNEKMFKEEQMGAAMREFKDLLTQLHQKMEEAANTICCTNCNGKHKRYKMDRPYYCARYCKKCNIRHAAREGDLWAESKCFGLLWYYYSCMDGGVYDITQWAACQSHRLKHLQANTHNVQYRIVTGAGNNNDNSGSNKSNANNRRHQQTSMPSDADLEEFLNSLYKQTMPGCSNKTGDKSNKTTSNQSKKKSRKKH